MSHTTTAGTNGTGPPVRKPGGSRHRGDASKGVTLFVMLVATLYFGRDVLLPVTLALLLAFLLAPAVTLLRRAHLGRVPSVLIAVTLAVSVLLLAGGVIVSQISDLSTDLPRYASTIENKISVVQRQTVGRLSKLADRVGNQQASPPATTPSPSAAAPPSPSGKPASAAQALVTIQAATPATPTPLQLAEQYLTPVLSPLATFGIVFIVCIFALLQREDLRNRLIRLIGADDIHRTTLAMDDAGRRLARYFLTQLCVNLAFGVVIGLGLLFIGVPKPVLWGIFAALLRFIPYVGSMISAVLPIALAAAAEQGWSLAIYTASLFLVAEGLTGQILEPMIYGNSTGLSPFSVVVAAIFWSWLWGPVGLFLSTPLTLILVVMGRHIKELEFLDVMLGDKAPLTPVESFYQRILADDPDEALAQAEVLLRQWPLSRYYDEVALKGMQLTTQDVERGALNDEQVENVKRTIYALVESLEDHTEAADPGGVTIPPARPPERWTAPSAILSIAGRGPLDEPAAAMLAQLLAMKGFGSRLVPFSDVTRYNIQNLDVTNVAMVCIAYLEITGGPAHLRYLIQRLRRQLPPGTPILVGLWAAAEPPSQNGEARTAIGADIFASSFAEVVDSCLTQAGNAETHGLCAPVPN